MASDWKKVDAYVNGPADYEEIPELTDEFFANGEWRIGGEPIKRSINRPVSDGTKQQVTLRLDSAVIDGFRATGPDWQARMNDVLREWLIKQAA